MHIGCHGCLHFTYVSWTQVFYSPTSKLWACLHSQVRKKGNTLRNDGSCDRCLQDVGRLPCFCLDIQSETRGSFFTPSKTGLDEFRAGVRRLARQNASCEVDNKAGVPVSWLRPCYKWHSTNGANKGRRRFKPWRWREVVSMKRLKMQNIQNQRRCGNKGLDAAEGHKYTNSLVPCYQHPNVATKNRFGFPSAKTFSRPSTRTNGFLCDFVRQKRFSLDLHIIGRSRGIGWTLVFFAPPSMN